MLVTLGTKGLILILLQIIPHGRYARNSSQSHSQRKGNSLVKSRERRLQGETLADNSKLITGAVSARMYDGQFP